MSGNEDDTKSLKNITGSTISGTLDYYITTNNKKIQDAAGLLVNLKPELPSNLKKGFYIINLSSSNMKGTHWTSFYYDKNKSIYFDSYGSIPPFEVHNKIYPYI